MIIALQPFAGAKYERASFAQALARTEQAFNLLSGGKLTGRASGTAAPSTGTWAQGDILYNSAPTEAGAASSKYVVLGWICTVAGTPGTWLQMRVLTGN